MDTPDELTELMQRARRALRHGRLDEAITLFQQGLETDDRNVSLHEGLATTYFMQEDYDDAIRHFQRMTIIDPRLGKPWINLGAVYNRMGNYSKAVEALRKGIPKERSCAQGQYNLGLAYRGLGQQSMAISAYREAIRIDPQMAEAHQNLANVYVDMGNLQQAIIHYRKALEIDPDFQRAQAGLQRAEEAREVATSAISPFGRLVDEQQTRARTPPGSQRELTDEERVDDRATLSTLTGELEAAAVAAVEELRGGLLPQLNELNRAVMQAEESPRNLMRAWSRYAEVLQTSEDARTHLRKTALRLRAHEELMNTPDFDRNA